MFKIGERYFYNGNKCTVYLVHKDKTRALVKYDNPLLGHSGKDGDNSYYCDDNGKQVIFVNDKLTGFYFVNKIVYDLIPINENIIDYEVY